MTSIDNGSSLRPEPAASAALTLVDQIVADFSRRIDDRLLGPGVRLPSIRGYAVERGVSRFTVVESYERLIARGYIEARPGSGFYVRPRDVASQLGRAHSWAESESSRIDVVWLMRNMFRQLPAADMPGGGVLPTSWLDGDLVGAGLRSLGREKGVALLGYGHPQGYRPLREALQQKLGQIGIAASVEQLLTTNGATQGLDLIARHLLAPGDAVLVEDPGWFLVFGRFAQSGARVYGVPRQADGPDLSVVAELAERHRPRLMVMSSLVHNPTGTSLSPARAHGLLQLAERFDFRIVDDDIYGDIHPGSTTQPATRLAALDQLQRVIHLGSFSKTLAANLRVGFIACEAGLARDLTDRKMMGGLTSGELGERVLYRVLSEGHYRRYLERLRGRLAEGRATTAERLDRLGLRRFDGHGYGMFHWVDTGVDAVLLAQRMAEQGYLMAPGSLFSPLQAPSSWMRFNVATSDSPRMLAALESTLDALRRTGSRHNSGQTVVR